ncbi:MAG: Hydrolase, HAD superfamily [uncultured Thermomicrobiales bacterium]|uniref:Hydrolase, HAD superfamily n=1 Tax=uncultured Thermomicrobiales bacterium TaxID=1645740 RepID=A0A6J4VLS4_9BACT|nr:MAG: Hydrolase, HAD superfamily [uncultured Thermomicrobiales bacterium]
MSRGTLPIRLIAIDLDGTLLRSDGTVSARTRAALTSVHTTGVATVIVTARPPRTVRLIAREAGLGGLAICANGALIYDLANEAVVSHVLLGAEISRRLIGALREAVPGVCFAVEAGLHYGQDPAYAIDSPHLEDADLRLDDACALCAEGVTKLIVRQRDWPLDDLARLISELVGASATVTQSGAPFVEVSAPGVTKAAALAALCAERGIDAAEVIACGDGLNDLPMLEWAGWAVAVANAHPVVLAAADEIIAANDEDGVAIVIESVVRSP